MQKDLTADDFPALGGTIQPSQQPPSAQGLPSVDGHPPGLNGLDQQQQHRQSLLGSLTVVGQQQPGLLNLGQAARGFQSDAEKRVSFIVLC